MRSLSIADATDTHCNGCRMNLGGCCIVHDVRLKWGVKDGHAVVMRLAECVAMETERAALIRDAEAWRRVRSAVLAADRQRSIAAIVTGELEHG